MVASSVMLLGKVVVHLCCSRAPRVGKQPVMGPVVSCTMLQRIWRLQQAALFPTTLLQQGLQHFCCWRLAVYVMFQARCPMPINWGWSSGQQAASI